MLNINEHIIEMHEQRYRIIELTGALQTAFDHIRDGKDLQAWELKEMELLLNRIKAGE